MLTVVEYKTSNGLDKKGFCSNYLADAKLGAEVNIYLRSNPSFHMKATKDKPILMIGAGSGIAPFRGFWQQELMSRTCSQLEGVDIVNRVKTYEQLIKSGENSAEKLEVRKSKKVMLQLIFGCWNEAGNLLVNETNPLSTFMNRLVSFNHR